MLHLDFTFADMRLIADFKILDPKEEGKWFVKIHDNLTGENSDIKLSEEEMGALANLIVAGDKAVAAETLYGVVGKKIDHLPQNLRPIP